MRIGMDGEIKNGNMPGGQNMNKNQDGATHCSLYSQNGEMECPLLDFIEDNFHMKREEVIHSLGLPSNMPDRKNRKKLFTKVQLVYRICSIGRWITGSIVIIFIAHLIWKQNRALHFIASHSGDNLFVADMGLTNGSMILIIVSVVLTIVLSVLRIVAKKKI